MQNRIKSIPQLQLIFPNADLTGIDDALKLFQMAITPYYASLIKKFDNTDPIFNMSVPQASELISPPFIKTDPLDEDHHSPVHGLIHRYGDRALIMATSTCAMYCRHCTRKRITSAAESCLMADQLDAIKNYLIQHSEIKDVIISGGDPFTLSTDKLESILSSVRSVSSVEIIRIGTRTPVTMPMRITDELISMLKRYHPVWINTHFNHPVEITKEAAEACTILVDAGIPLGNQTVLLHGVNDTSEIIGNLCRDLIRIRVRPYYLFQCDMVPGVEHFRTPITHGINIMRNLRGRISGIAIPTYVVDGNIGKIPVLPDSIISSDATNTTLCDSNGNIMIYQEPSIN